MPKTIGASLKTHLQGESTTICTCFEITRRDGVVFRFTDLDRDLEVSGETYVAAFGFSRTAIAADATLDTNNADVEGIFDDAEITATDLRRGLFDFADVRVFLVNYEDTSQGILRLQRGTLGEVQSTPEGTFRAELRGLLERLSQRIGEVYTAECRADLGDSRCQVPISPPVVERNTAYAVDDYVDAGVTDRIHRCTVAGTTAGSDPGYDPDVGDTTVDGTASFITEEAWTRSATVASVHFSNPGVRFTITVTEPRAVTGWFTHGAVLWLTGNNAGTVAEISSWFSTTVILYMPAVLPIQVGDTLLIYPGCDKSLATCRDKFDNVLNFRGEPYVPGQDHMNTIPDAKLAP